MEALGGRLGRFSMAVTLSRPLRQMQSIFVNGRPFFFFFFSGKPSARSRVDGDASKRTHPRGPRLPDPLDAISSEIAPASSDGRVDANEMGWVPGHMGMADSRRGHRVRRASVGERFE